MSTTVPTISVTAHHHHSLSSTSSESDSESSNDNDMDYGRNCGGSTDIEDFDSQAEAASASSEPKKFPRTALRANISQQNDVTDVEDYDTDSETDLVQERSKSPAYPELKISLQDFLQLGNHEDIAESNGATEKVEHKTGNFLQAQNLSDLNDYLTDCEDYNTDSELENECEKSVCVDLDGTFGDQGRVSIADATRNSMDAGSSQDDCDDISVASNVSDMASAVSEADNQPAHGNSEDEVLELSGDEEICQIAFSDSECKDDEDVGSEEDLLSNCSLTPLDITFVAPRQLSAGAKTTSSVGVAVDGSQKMFLNVTPSTKEEVLTEVEGLDDDDEDSFDDDENPIPQAVILAPGDDGGCLTDCEDITCEDTGFSDDSGSRVAASVDANALPQPQREVVLLQEDKFGDTITSIVPMDDEYQFGINVNNKEECVTDSEDYSCADEDSRETSIAEALLPTPAEMTEGDITIANELLKPHQSKRLEIQSNVESVTDVEEIFMDGTSSRRKKLKTRSMSKGKSTKQLFAPRVQDEGATDVEDMCLSDSGLSNNSRPTDHLERERQQLSVASEKVRDVEDITSDDMSSVSDADLPSIDTKASNLKDYDESSTNVVVALETCGTALCRKHRKSLPSARLEDDGYQNSQQQQTDVEDVQLPSDAEADRAEAASPCLCKELSEMLNESCTTVHERCSNSFNVDAEKQHIKGMPREALTDIEYVESDESAARGSK